MPKEKKQSALTKPVEISEELAVIIGEGPMPRTEATKKLWDYIKRKKLQDPNAKRMINPDEALAKVFGKKGPIDMFEMTKLVSKHMKELAMSSR